MQPRVAPTVRIGCTEPATIALNTVTLQADKAAKGKLKFLVDTGAQVSLCKYESIKEGSVYDPGKVVDVRGISCSTERTLGEIALRLSTENHETTHNFHVVGDGIRIPYDGILGQDFFASKKANIDFQKREIVMGDVKLKFDERVRSDEQGKQITIVLKARCETIVKMPTTSRELKVGLLKKTELLPGIIMAETLTVVREGGCLTSILNMNDEEVSVSLPVVTLEECDVQSNAIRVEMFVAQGAVTKESRLRELRKRIRTDHLNDKERRAIMTICEYYNEIFRLPGDKLTTTTAIEHAIPTPGIDPCRGIASRNYLIPDALKDELQGVIQQMLSDKIIRHSKSPWNSPIILVKKKEDASKKEKWRLVVDFRRLNEVTVGDSYPLPLITDILSALGKARYYTTADLASGFYQVPLREVDRQKTAFSTPGGHYEFCNMPMGICSAPATFQRLMNTVLSGLVGTKVLLYLDDLVVWGTTLEEHNQKLVEVFDRLRVQSLKLEPDKCEFLRKEVYFLGYKVTANGVAMDERKVAAINHYPVPTTTKQLKAFLGLAGFYRKFVPRFSHIAAPLHKLTRKNVPYVWGEEQAAAFQTLKGILCSEPLLQYPDFKKGFIVTCDASSTGIGSVLSQGPLGRDLPVAYASRVLTKSEKNYSTIERELLAITWGCKQFRQYIWGRKFTIVTDHKPLTWIFRMNDPHSRIMRMKLKLQEFDYTIVYKRGKENSNSDALSRMFSVTEPVEAAVNAVSKEIERSELPSDSEGSEVAEENPKGGMESGTQCSTLSEKQKLGILKEIHDSPLGGHVGINRTYRKLKQFVDWTGMKNDVENYIRTCGKCQKNKMTQCHTRMPLVLTDTPSTVFQKCSVDIVGPFNLSGTGYRYILTVQDDLSKFLIAVPLEDQTAEQVARAFVDHVILIYGIPQIILSDCGSQFLSDTFKSVCKLLGIKRTHSTSFRPQTNGSNERSHKSLIEYIRSYVDTDLSNWDQWVKYATFVHNTTPHSATNYMPFQLLFGRLPNLPGVLQRPPPSTFYAYDSYVKELEARLQSSYNIARQKLESAKAVNKRQYDRRVYVPNFKVGEKVLVKDESVRRGRSKKLEAPYVGPYEIIGIEGSNLLLRTKRSKNLRIHANRAKLFFA